MSKSAVNDAKKSPFRFPFKGKFLFSNGATHGDVLRALLHVVRLMKYPTVGRA